MPQTRSCEYCGDDIEPGTGTMLVRTNGSTIHYCSSKCEKNDALGREPRDLEWTESGGGQRTGEPAVEQAEADTTEEAEPAAEEVDEAETAADEEDAEDESIEAEDAEEDAVDEAADGAAEEVAEEGDAADEGDEDDE